MVHFIYLTGSQTDLVTVGAVTCSCSGNDLLLWQFARDGFAEWGQRISSTGYAHCLIYIGTTGQWVTDRTAQTGSSAAEWLDFGWMVVGFVFEHQQPILIFAVNINGDLNGASVDLFGFVQISQFAVCFQSFCADGSQIHEADRFVSANVEFFTELEVFVVGIFDVVAVDIYILNDGGECGMTAVVGPVGIDHADLGDGWAAFFIFAEVFLAEGDISQVHSKTVVFDKCFQTCFIQFEEAFQYCDISRYIERSVEGGQSVQSGFTGFHWIDQVFLDFQEIFVADITGNNVNLCRCNGWTLILCSQLDALCSGVCTLVELTRQILYSEDTVVGSKLRENIVDVVNLWFGEDAQFCHFEVFCRDVFHIVAVDDTDAFNAFDTEGVADVGKNTCSFYCKWSFLFDINSVNRHNSHSYVI